MITKGSAQSKAGIKSHAIQYQYVYIGTIVDIPPKQTHLKTLMGSFMGRIGWPQWLQFE